MPATIPTFRQKTEIPSSQGSRIPLPARSESIGGALANLGGIMIAHGERQARIQDELDKATALNDAQLVINDTALNLSAGLNELKVHGLSAEEYRSQGEQLISDYYDKLADPEEGALSRIRHPEAQLYAAQKLGVLRLKQTLDLRADYNERAASESKATALLEVDKLERRAIAAGSLEEADAVLGEAQTFLTTHGGLGLSPAEAANQMLKSAAKVRFGRVYADVRRNPEQALEVLGDPEKTSAVGLADEQIVTLRNLAQNEINSRYAQSERTRIAEDREVSKQRDDLMNAAVRKIVQGADLTADLAQGSLGKSLSNQQVENLVGFQREYRSGREAHSDPETLLRMRVAARTGRDPLTGERISVNALLNAPEISAANRGALAVAYLDQQDAQRGKAETLRGQLVKKGEQSIRSVLGEIDEFGRIMDQSSRIDVYEALQEYDAQLSVSGKQDPRDIAEDIITKRLSRKGTTLRKGDPYRAKDGGLDRNKLAEAVLSGGLSRLEANAILRAEQTRSTQAPKQEAEPAPVRKPVRKSEVITR